MNAKAIKYLKENSKLPLLDWNRDSAENGWGADDVGTAGGGNGAVNRGGGNVDGPDEVADVGGGVGLVTEFVAGDNCVVLVL